MKKKPAKKTLYKTPIKQYLLLLLLFLLAFIPRLFYVMSLDRYFGYEQGELMLGTYGIVHEHRYPLLGPAVGGVGGFAKGPGFTYLLVIPYLLGQGDPYALRIFMFVISLATAVLAYFLIRKQFSERTALFITFLISISPMLILFAGGIFTPFVMPILTIILLYYLYKLFAGEERYAIAVFLILGVMVHIEIASVGFFFIQLIIFFVYLFRKRMVSFATIGLSFLVFIVFFFPMFLYDLQSHFANTKGILALIQPGNKHSSYFSNIPGLLYDRLETFHWNIQSTFSPSIFIWTVVVLFMIIGGIVYLKDKKVSHLKKLFMMFLLSSAPLTFFLLLFYPSYTFIWWLFQLSIIYIYIVGILADYFFYKTPYRILIILFVVVLSAGFVSRTYTQFKRDFGFNTKGYVYQRDPIDYTFTDGKKTKFSVIILSPKEKTLDYQYLLKWRGDVYHYHPLYGVSKTFYVIQEQDPTQLKKQKDQLKRLPGKLVSSKLFGNTKTGQDSYIVQKRVD